MRCWIYDRVNTPQGFALEALLETVFAFAGRDVRLVVTRARGYGERVQQLDQLLDECDSVAVSTAEAVQLCAGLNEWFYDVEFICSGQGNPIRFGIHDSTAMFVDAEAAIAVHLHQRFRDVRCTEDS